MKTLLTHCLLSLLFIGVNHGLAQTHTPPDGSEDQAAAHQFFGGAGYGTNLIYYGTSVSGDQPYFSAEMIYAWDKGFWASAGLFHLPDQEPFFSFTDLSAGYAYVFNKTLDAGLSASRYHTEESIDTTFYSDYTFLGANLGIDWLLLYTTLMPGWLLAEENSFYLVIDNTHFFRTPAFGKKEAYLTFNPGMSLLFGSYAWLRQYRRQGSGGQGPGYGGNRYSTTTAIEEEDFRLLDLQLSIPIEFFLGRFSLEFEPAYFVNFIQEATQETEDRFFFTLGLYYKIN